jgi:peptidoglycan/LPS O-acetylase OafA/YrhL
VNDWITAAGAALFILIALHSTFAKRLLLLKPVHFIGKISYSLYLIHMVVLYACIHALSGLMPLWAVLAAAVLLSFAAAAILYFILELPAIRLGKALTASRTESGKRSVTVKA